MYLTLLIFSSAIILFLSCSKENIEKQPSQIVFEIPVKSDTILENTYDKVFVYPNPFITDINVRSTLPQGDTATVQLSDSNGEFITSVKVSTSIWTIDTRDYPIGVYYIEVLIDGYVDRAKILKIEQ